MKAVIMAGGEGTRLRPMTVTCPKPMLALCNRPVLEYVVSLLVRHGVDHIIITLHYLAEDVISYFGDGSDFGVKISYSLEDVPLGTAGSVKKLDDVLDETFLVISGDGLTDIDLSRLLSYHREKGAIATLTLTRVEKPVEYGVVITDSNNRIERFLEKPSWGEVFSDQVNTGIYVVEPEVLKLMEPNKAYDFSHDIFPQLLDDKRGLYGYVTNEYWCDMGDLENFRKSVADLFDGRVLHEMVGTERWKGCWVGEGTKIHKTAHLEAPFVIGRNCRIGANAYIGPYTCVGNNSIIEDEAYLHRAILFNDVFFGRLSRATNCIVGRHCTIKTGVTLDDGSVLGDKCFVGRGATIKSQVKVWPCKHIADGNTISMDVIWGELTTASSMFTQDGVLGLGNIEITPEFAMRLGAAFGSLLPKGSIVATSRDSHSASRLVNRALITGLTSVGVNIMDCRHIPAPICRYYVQNSGALGGIHTHIYNDDARYIEIKFFDARGVNINTGMERKIENIFARQDFRRTTLDEVGEIAYADDPIGTYVEDFVKQVDVTALREAKLKVVIDHAYGNASMVLPTLLSKLGIEAVNLNAYMDPHKAHQVYENPDLALTQLGDIVTPLHANLGVLFDIDGERFCVVDEKGKIVPGECLLALMAYMVFRNNSGAVVAVPLYASRVLELVAQHCKGRIVRTKSDLRSLMDTAAAGQERLAMAGTPSGYFVHPAFSYGIDAMFAGCKLLELMVSEEKALSEMAARIPAQHSLYCYVNCDWSAKAKVMRLLVDLYRDQIIDGEDGVRIRFEDGVALIVAHPTLGRLRIWVDGDSHDSAQEIMDQLQTVIEELQETNDEDQDVLALASKVNLPHSVILPEERAFHFWIPGRYLGIQARSLRTFIDILRYVEVESLNYHAGRRDFSLWIASELGRTQFAEAVARIEPILRGEELRQGMLQSLNAEA